LALSDEGMAIQKTVRQNRPVIVPIKQATAFQPGEDRVWLSDALFVIESVVKLINPPLVCQREPRIWF
jgi:hypothetical protein